jgi:beta-glucanase (GH16 family)
MKAGSMALIFFRCTFVLFSILLPTACQVGTPPYQTGAGLISPPLPGYALIWHEEFNGTKLDPSKWTAYSGPRRGARNTPDAVAVANGVLTITTFSEDSLHYTGFVDTAEKFLTSFGWFEARIRFESSPGEWGAFWIQTPTMGNPVDNVSVAGAEIDVVEHRATDSAGVDISNSYAINLHWNGYGAFHRHEGGLGSPPTSTSPLQGGWHTYAVLWTAEGYTFFLDGTRQWATQSGASHRPEFIKLTCEVQNASWAGSIPAGGYRPLGKSATRMQVDWVRVWQPAR